ncbi:MAG: protein-methionine-sulfoxide reductase catalytic subunit MsrP [Myxococcales bacterium]|nr:protein-methionine-sulfoxide reductase catalytic subunit MsrP [Myxococcales bacterium]
MSGNRAKSSGPLIRVPRGWEIPEREATPEGVYWSRREVLRALGYGTLAAGGAAAIGACDPRDALGLGDSGPAPKTPIEEVPVPDDVAARYPGKRSTLYTLDRPITDRRIAASYNNFYEFTTDKAEVWRRVGAFEPRPWTLEVTGLVGKPGTFDPDDLVRRFPIEERLYRFRCVEAWSMAVPWNGFPMKALLKAVEPKPEARFVRFVTGVPRAQAPGMRAESWYPWPYFEGLSIEEAMADLAFFATGIYGRPLLKQHGAPIRAVVPWKYGYKSIKSISRIEFVADRPETFWHKLAPDEYGFVSNIDPKKPHPRWSQATERVIGTDERRSTQYLNGYAEFVGHLYS